MSVVVIGLNHRTAPVGLLERFTVAPDRLGKLLDDLCSRPNISEAVVLSTCNRTEVYARAERFHAGYGDVREALCLLSDVEPLELDGHLYSDHDDGAVAHLFAVACGLDSDVLGETEILGQVRTAWSAAREHGAARATLNLLFRHAIEVGKRARTETGISRSTSSVSHAAVEMARDHLGSLTGRSVLVLGAGDMGEGIAVALAAGGVDDVVIANRSVDRAVTLAQRVGGRSISLDAAMTAVERADVVLCSVAVPGFVTADRWSGAYAAGRQVLVIDVSVPRCVEAAVGALDGVTLLDLDDLQAWADRGREERQGEVAAVQTIIDEELRRYDEVVIGRQAAPLIADLHSLAGDIRQRELDRVASRLSKLEPVEREAVEALTRAIVAKLLHPLSHRLRDDAGTPRGERNAAALRDLFDLP